MAFESTTDIVVRTLFASKQVSSSFSNKIVREAKGDAASFVASNGQIRGSHLESAFKQVRTQNPDLQVSDLELAEAILAQ